MAGITLLIAFATAFLIFVLSPVKGLVLYAAMLVWFPSYMHFQIGPANFTVTRVIMIAIMANLVLLTDLPKKMRFHALDLMVVASFISQIIAGLVTTPAGELLLNRSGAMFEMVLPYFAVRMIITDKEKYISFLKGALYLSAPLALLGVVQMLTGRNVFDVIPGHVFGSNIKFRSGFYRANLTFSVSIMFGLYFAMLTPVCVGLWKTLVKERDKLIVALACMFLGVISSMSSGPLLALMVTIPFLLAYRYRSHWKIGILIIVMGCTFIEIISNRHFWETIDRFTFSSKTAWYRTRLIEVALFEDGMTDHWLAGHGLDDPGWSMKIDLRSHTDMVNHYILILSRYGLIGFIPFMLMLKRAAKSLICAIKHANSHPDRWLAWTLAGAFLGLLASLFSVSLFGPPITMFYLLLSFCPVVERIVNQENAKLLTLEELDEETAIEKGVFT